MSDLREAAQQALDFVTSKRWGTVPYMDGTVFSHAHELAVALQAALNAPQQQPIAWGCPNAEGEILDVISPAEHAEAVGDYTVPLYARPVLP